MARMDDPVDADRTYAALANCLARAVVELTRGHFFNPSVIVIGGDVADAQEQLLAGIRGSSISGRCRWRPVTCGSSGARSTTAPE